MRLTDIMSNAGLSGYAEIALVLFLVAFSVVVLRIFLPSRRQDLERAGRMPLDDDIKPTTRDGAAR